LRSAFSGTDLLPDEILWRPKEAFSDGVSSTKRSWYKIAQERAAERFSDGDLEAGKQRYSFNPPTTMESLLYRTIFEETHAGMAHLIPYMWLPKWTSTNDPSARELSVYRK